MIDKDSPSREKAIEKTCKCIACGSNLFKIEKKKICSNCKFNGAYDEDEDEYIYNEKNIKEKNLIRTEASDDSSCYFGSCFNNGCYIFTCAKCGDKTFMPLVDY